MAQKNIISQNPTDTQKLAEKLAKNLKPKTVLALTGELGSGKTTFIQGLARSLGVQQRLTSPTFVLMRSYHLPKLLADFVHFDLYRLKHESDLLTTSVLETLKTRSIIAIEWPEIILNYLPSSTYFINFQYGARPDQRMITIRRSAKSL